MWSPPWFSGFKFVVVALTICRPYNDIGVEAGPGATRLMKQLFVDKEYDVNSIPVEEDKHTMQVTATFELVQVIDLDIKNEVMRTNIRITLRWRDYQLKWKPEDYGGVGWLVLPDDKIWKPTLLLQNGITGADDKITFSKVQVWPDGNIVWLTVGQFTSSCDINVEWFPFDRQKCDMTFVLWSEGNDTSLSIPIFEDDEDITEQKKDLLTDGEWQIVGTDSRSHDADSDWHIFKGATFSIRMKRLPLFYITNLVLPCALITFLAVIAFVLPPDGGDKIGLSITVLLALTVYMLIVAGELPPTPEVIPLIDVYFIVLMVLSTLSVIGSVFVVSLHNVSPDARRMPNWVRLVFCQWMAWFLRVRPPGKKMTYRDLVCRTKSEPDEESVDLRQEVSNTTAPAAGESTQLSAILTELRRLTNKVREDDKFDELADEWKLVAKVIDRLCLLLFCLFFVLGTVIVFMRVPA